MQSDIDKHIRRVSIICMVIGGLYLLALAFAALLSLMAAHNAGSEAPLLPAAMAVAPFFLLLALLGIWHIATGHAFRTGRNWSRLSLWVLAVLNIGNVPVGTAFGFYAIWLLRKTRPQTELRSSAGKQAS